MYIGYKNDIKMCAYALNSGVCLLTRLYGTHLITNVVQNTLHAMHLISALMNKNDIVKTVAGPKRNTTVPCTQPNGYFLVYQYYISTVAIQIWDTL